MTPERSLPLSWMTRDAALIVTARGMRSFGFGAVSVVMAIYLHLLGLSTVQIGLFLSSGLAGAAVYTLAIVFIGDSFGRRRLLVLFAVMMAVAAVAVVATDAYALIVIAAVLGGFSVAGGASAGGAIQPLEHASLADLTRPERRTDLYAVYGIAGTAGTSFGALAAGLPTVFEGLFGLSELGAIKIIFLAFAFLLALSAIVYALLSPAVEVHTGEGRNWVNPLRLPSRRYIFTLSGLFSVDHFAGGLVVQTLVSLWFFTKFGIDLGAIGLIFFGSNLMAAVSLWMAAKLAGRIGLINTMVFTHIPSSLLLIALPFLPTVWLAASFWLVRGFFGQMDVPTRQSYTMAVVEPNERSAMAGISTISRSLTGTASPSVATFVWSIGATSVPFVSAGVLKIVYDLSLYALFRKVKPPEEAP